MGTNYRYEQERDSKKRQNIQEVVEFILDNDYGTMLYNEDLSKILGYNFEIEEEYYKYKSIMQRVKNFLLQYGYVLKSVGGVGYYILRPTEIARHCYKTYIKRAAKMYDKSAYVLDRTDKSQMNEERLQEITDLIEVNQKLIDNAWNTLKESAYYSRKDYYESMEG